MAVSLDPIIPETSFLRKLPICLETSQRLRYATAVFASDILSDAFLRLHSAAIAMGKDAPKRPAWERAVLHSCCWTIVDQLYLLRQVLSVAPPRIKAVSNFIKKYEAAYDMRNTLDHINQQADNLSKTTEARAAVFGEVLYVHYDPRNQRTVDGVNKSTVTVLILNGGPKLHYPQPSLASVLGAGSRLMHPVSHFRFSVGRHKLDLDEIGQDLREAASALADDFEATMVPRIKADAAERGLSLHELMEPSTDNMQLAVEIEYETEQIPA